MASLALILRLLVVLGVFRLLALPLARLVLPRLPATAYAVATTIGLALAGHVIWLSCHLGLRLGGLTIGLGLAVLAASSALALKRLRRLGMAILPGRRSILVYHLAFALAFALALLVTARNPSVDPDSERFMDYAMVNAVASARTLPLPDPWLAGYRVMYYDYGYFSTAWLSLLVGPAERFFPVAVALLWPALLGPILALALDLGGWRGGALAAFLVSIAGNLDAVFQPWSGGISFDWFKSARVLDGCITEFPLFALLWGDLHPYVLALPLWPVLLAIGAQLSRGELSRVTAVVGAVMYAALIPTHLWDAVPIAAFLLILGLRSILPRWRGAPSSGMLWRVCGLLGLGGLLAGPFLVAAPTGGRGLRWVEQPSTGLELLTAWGIPLAVIVVAAVAEAARESRARSARLALPLLGVGLVVAAFPAPGVGIGFALAGLALVLAFAEEAESAFAWTLAAVGLGLVAGVELLYVDDFYEGNLARMNTVFKAYVEAWMLLALGAALLLATLWRSARTRWPRVALAGLTALVVGAGLAYPVRAIPARTGALFSPIGLDSRIAFQGLYPDDAEAAQRLREQPRGVVLEATGDPYSWHSRFATFTGFPTVVGWGHHEAGWRNTWQPMLERATQIGIAYTTPDVGEATRLLDGWNVRYIAIGSLERDRFPRITIESLPGLHEVIRAGATVVYRYDPRPAAGGHS